MYSSVHIKSPPPMKPNSVCIMLHSGKVCHVDAGYKCKVDSNANEEHVKFGRTIMHRQTLLTYPFKM